jgi:uncharacterized protein YjiK
MKVILIIIFLIGCTINPRELSKGINSYNFSAEPDRVFKLSNKLKEISGLAMDKNNRLFGHEDESSKIYQIDHSSGKIVKSFTVGKKTIKKDFEGLAIASDLFYLVTSSGDIYEFGEGDDDEHVKYDKFKTFLQAKNDVEGLCYDKASESLLLACKGDPGKDYKGYKTVYSFSLINKKLSEQPVLKVDLSIIEKQMEKGFSKKLADFFQISEGGFAPSGIEIHPKSGTYYILSANGRLILELSRNNEILGISMLNKKNHPQPEGIAFSVTNELIIADEGGNGKALLTVYTYL